MPVARVTMVPVAGARSAAAGAVQPCACEGGSLADSGASHTSAKPATGTPAPPGVAPAASCQGVACGQGDSCALTRMRLRVPGSLAAGASASAAISGPGLRGTSAPAAPCWGCTPCCACAAAPSSSCCDTMDTATWRQMEARQRARSLTPASRVYLSTMNSSTECGRSSAPGASPVSASARGSRCTAAMCTFSSSVYPASRSTSSRSSSGPGMSAARLAVATNVTRDRSKGRPRYASVKCAFCSGSSTSSSAAAGSPRSASLPSLSSSSSSMTGSATPAFRMPLMTRPGMAPTYVRLCPRTSASSLTPPSAILTRGRPSTSATERASDVLPTPGAPMKHRMGARPADAPRSRSTAMCSSTLSFTLPSP
mmetsp:Transcript_2711/g.6864  ORF Transcript_2711/g.6864 Transcript_2711/m.6864 type:complete len:368 (-) Transcript_2711:906-2009(-)